MVGRSQFTFAALYFNLLNTSKGLMPAHRTEYYMKKGQELKQLIQVIHCLYFMKKYLNLRDNSDFRINCRLMECSSIQLIHNQLLDIS